jgi:hypothetical protein
MVDPVSIGLLAKAAVLVFPVRQLVPIIRHPGEGRDPRQQAAILGLS